jgi:hypothetical protein
MEPRSFHVSLKGFGSVPSSAHVVVESLDLRQRVIRAAMILAGGLALALIAVPIPLVHFVLVPGAILLGLILAVVRFRQREVFRLAEGACPFCGTQQRLGLAGRVFRLPRQVFCRNCGRSLDLGEDTALSKHLDPSKR